MKQLSLLIKVQASSLLNFKKRKTASKYTLLIGVFAYLGLCLIVAAYVFGIGKALLLSGYIDLMPLIMMLIATLMLFLTGYVKVKGTVFAFKDYQLLMSLPISYNNLVLSRIAYLYIFNLLITSIMMLPTNIVYGYLTNRNVMFYIISFLLIFLIPIIPMIISVFVGFIIGLITERFRHSNLISIAISIGFTLLYMYGMTGLSATDPNMVIEKEQILTIINRYYPVSELYYNATIHYNIIDLIYYIGLSIVIGGIFTIIFAKNFKRINSMFESKYSKGNYKHKDGKSNSILLALYKKEFKRYLSSSIYVLNTSIMVVLITIASISLFFVTPEELLMVLEIPQMSDGLSLVAALGVSLSVGMCYITGCSISLEGNNLWILRKAPIRERDIFLSKILVNLTITIPAVLINSTVMSILMKFSFLEVLVQYILPIGITILCSIVGISVNLKLPKLDYKSEVYVVKQSASAFVCMLICIIPIGLVFLLELFSIKFNLDYGLEVGTALIYVLIYLSYKYLNTYGARDFRKL